MITIKIKNKSLLKEAGELKYSQIAFNKIYKIYRENIIKDNPDVSEIVEVPIKDFLFNTNKDILNGCILFIKLTLENGNVFDNVEEMKKNWDVTTKSFKQNFIDSVLNQTQLKIHFNMGTVTKAYGDSADGYVNAKANVIELWLIARKPTYVPGSNEITPMRNIVNWDYLKSTIKHELQHVTQIINSICITYSKELNEQLKQNNDSSHVEFDTIPRYHMKSIMYFAGSGKTKSKERGDPRKDYKKYLLNSEEYKPHLTNIIDEIITSIFKQKFITKNHLALAKIKELPVKERLKYINNRVKEQPYLFDKQMFVTMLNNARTFEDLVKQYIAPMIQTGKIINYLYTADSAKKMQVYLDNKKEFPKDLLIGINKRLRQISDKMVIKYYNDKN